MIHGVASWPGLPWQHSVLKAGAGMVRLPVSGMVTRSPGCSSPLISFSPPLDQDDYLWGLDSGEGISDLFDTYDLGDLLIN